MQKKSSLLISRVCKNCNRIWLTDLVNWKTSTDVISEFSYTHDDVGNRMSMTTEDGTHDYGYDDIYELITVDYPTGSTFSDQTFHYDSAWNRTTTVNGGTVDYLANDLNQYTEVDGVSFDYDDNGNLTTDGDQTYYYNCENLLTRVVRNSDGATLAEYKYDPFGRRAKKITNGGSTVVNYIYDGARVIEERDGDWDLLRRYVYGSGIDEPISIYDDSSSEYYFYLRDGLGSLTELVDESGDVVEHYRYSSYGKRKIYNSSWNELSASLVGNPYYFTGRRFDEESGLFYYRARMYSAEVGRFLQVDPIGYWDDLNLYRYCGNNPLNKFDPLGMQPENNNSGKPSGWWSTVYAFVDAAAHGAGTLMDWILKAPKTKYAIKHRHTTRHHQARKWLEDLNLPQEDNPWTDFSGCD